MLNGQSKRKYPGTLQRNIVHRRARMFEQYWRRELFFAFVSRFFGDRNGNITEQGTYVHGRKKKD